MNLFSKTFYILNFQIFFLHGKIRNLQVGLRVWSGWEILSKKINKEWRAHNAPPIITKVKFSNVQSCVHVSSKSLFFFIPNLFSFSNIIWRVFSLTLFVLWHYIWFNYKEIELAIKISKCCVHSHLILICWIENWTVVVLKFKIILNTTEWVRSKRRLSQLLRFRQCSPTSDKLRVLITSSLILRSTLDRLHR